jgi:hypothetical protein
MHTSSVQSAKLALISFLGLSRDALHISVGLLTYLLAVLLLRRSLGAIYPLLVVGLVAVAGEVLDGADDVRSLGYWRWSASIHDVVVTIFWPSVLVLLARSGWLESAGPKRNS